MKKLSFNQLVAEAKENPEVLGLFLTGSRGKEFHKKTSDYDAWMIVKEGAQNRLRKKYNHKTIEDTDLSVNSVKDFKNYATWQSDDRWDRYDFAHTKILFEKTGKIEKMIKEKGRIPKSKQKEFISGALDGYINAFFRSMKAKQKGYKLGSLLEASQSIPPLLDSLFALELRHAPFFGYLKHELKSYPLKQMPFPSVKFLSMLRKILQTGDVKMQQALFKKMKRLFSNAGYKKIFDDWDGKDDWASNLKNL